MKQIILSLAIALSSLAATATETVVNNEVFNAFNKQFAQASEVKWTKNASYFKAEFVYNTHYLTAFFETDGTMIGLSRNISSLDLPLNLQMSLRQDHKGYWISELFEVSSDAGTEYYVTLNSADSKITLKANAVNGWASYKKVVKL